MKLIRILLLLLLLSFSPRPALACEPHPDHWFAETVTFDLASLPEAFRLYEPQFGSLDSLPEGLWLFAQNTNQVARSAIYIINRTPDPLYILSLQYLDRLVMETPDPSYKARIDMAHEVASYLLRPDLGEVLPLNFEALQDLDQNLADPNTLSYSPPAPDIALPPAQRSELLLVWGEQVLVVPFTITYQLNALYNNGGCEQWWASQNATEAARYAATQAAQSAELQRKLVLIGAGFVAGVCIAIWLARRRAE